MDEGGDTMRNVSAALLFVAAIASGTADARASGVVTGTFGHIESNQGYCPDSRTGCTSSTYPQSQYRNGAMLSNVLVRLYSASSSTPKGEDYTDENGQFEIAWSGSSFSNGYLKFVYESPRFKITNTAGATWSTSSAQFNVPDGNSNAGSWWLGSSTSPNDVTNIYSAANRQFVYAMDYVTDLVNDASAVKAQIMYPDNSCPSACYNLGTEKVSIPDDATDTSGQGPFGGPSRVAHELGHWGVDHVTTGNAGSGCNFYRYPSLAASTAANPGGWGLFDAAWGCVAYAEGAATFLSDVSRYWAFESAIADTCTAGEAQACATMLESSQASSCELTNPCPSNTDQRRSPLAVTKVFWDAYDSSNDGNCSEDISESYFSLVMAHNNFAAGQGDRKLDEWQSNTARDDGPGPNGDDDGFEDGAGQNVSDVNELRPTSTSVSNNRRDQSGMYDYWWNYFDVNGIALWRAYYNNCAPPGN
jgi:hypothetical protein